MNQNEHKVILNIIENEANQDNPIKLTNSFMMNTVRATKKKETLEKAKNQKIESKVSME